MTTPLPRSQSARIHWIFVAIIGGVFLVVAFGSYRSYLKYRHYRLSRPVFIGTRNGLVEYRYIGTIPIDGPTILLIRSLLRPHGIDCFFEGSRVYASQAREATRILKRSELADRFHEWEAQ